MSLTGSPDSHPWMGGRTMGGYRQKRHGVGYRVTGVSTPKLALSVYLKDNFERTSTEDTHLHRAEAMRVFLIVRGDIPRLFIDNQVKEPTRTTGGVGGI